MKLFSLLQQQFSLIDLQDNNKKWKNEVIPYLDMGIQENKKNVKNINSRFFGLTEIVIDKNTTEIKYDNNRCFVRIFGLNSVIEKFGFDEKIREFKCLISDTVKYYACAPDGAAKESEDDLAFVYIALCASFLVKNEEFRKLSIEAQSEKQALKKLTVLFANALCSDMDIRFERFADLDYSDMKNFYDLITADKDRGAVDKFDINSFSEEYRQLIPTLSSKYGMLDDYEQIARAILNPEVNSVLLYGESGTGKSVACKMICEAVGLPVMSTINCTDNLDEFVLGKFIPTENGFTFAESMFTKAIRYGGAVIVEEINFARPELLSFLNSLLDFNGFVILDDGRTVKRHPNFKFFATMNVNYYGTRDLNLALQNRFSIIKKSMPITDERITDNLLKIDKGVKPFVKQILKIYHGIRSYIESNGCDAVITPRTLESFVRLGTIMPYSQAARLTLYQIKLGDDGMERAIDELFNQYIWEK